MSRGFTNGTKAVPSPHGIMFLCLIVLLIALMSNAITTVPHASMIPAQEKPVNIIFGTIDCTSTTPCSNDIKFALSYDTTQLLSPQDEMIAANSPSLNGASFTASFYDNSTNTHLLDTIATKLKAPGKIETKNTWTHEPLQPFKTSEHQLVGPLRYIITFSREVKNFAPQKTTLKVILDTDEASVTITDTSRDILDFKGSTPSGHLVIGPVETEKIGLNDYTPYDNAAELDLDLSFYKWDDIIFDSIALYPIGLAGIGLDEYAYQCLFGGQYIGQTEIISPENDQSYHYLKLTGISNIIHRNNASFNGPNQLQLQCIFTISPELQETLQLSNVSFGLELIVDENDQRKNPTIWFAPKEKQTIFSTPTPEGYDMISIDTSPFSDPDPKTSSYLSVSTIAPRSYLASIGNSPSAAVQSRFNRILLKDEKIDSKGTKRYVSYYSIALPMVMPNTLFGQQHVINALKEVQSMTVLVTGEEMVKTNALDYAHFFIRCNRETAHFNLIRSTTAMWGRYSVESRAASGPGNNQVSITHPRIFLNPEFTWPADQQTFEDKPSCSSWSFDLNIGVYTENIPEDMIINSIKYASGIRLRHGLTNNTDHLLRHDWISSYDVNSAESDAIPNTSNHFQLTNMTKHVATKDPKAPTYWTFNMIIDTTGIKKPEDQVEDTMSFFLKPIGGNIQFYLPIDQVDDDDHLAEPIVCHISYNDKDGKAVEGKLSASIVTDLNLSFDLIDPPGDTGLPFDTANIKVSCDNLRIMQIGLEPVNQFESNFALCLPQDTFTAPLFGHPYSPSREGRSAAAKFGIFVLVIVIITIVAAIALKVIDHLTNGKVVQFYKNNIEPLFARCCPCCRSNGHSSSGSDVSDEYDQQGVGTYGSYQGSALN